MNLNRTISTYCSLMEEIKLRYEVITTCLTKPVLRPRIMYELCYLQLRMICELIALGCLVAHGDIRETHSKKMRETWEADRIMKTLETLHAKFYPKPIRYIEDEKGIPTHYQPIFVGFLTKSDLTALYAKCGEVLHRGSLKTVLMTKQKPRHSNEILNWSQKIMLLLGNHHIELVDSDLELRFCMHNRADGRPFGQVMKRIPLPTTNPAP